MGGTIGDTAKGSVGGMIGVVAGGSMGGMIGNADGGSLAGTIPGAAGGVDRARDAVTGELGASRRVVLPNRSLRLAFFGTPPIAATVLRGLIDSREDEVVLTVCQPDRPRGRGQQLEAPAVKILAEGAGIEVLQPERLKDGVLAKRLAEEHLDLAIVCAYGRIIPEAVFRAAEAGSWNVHTSILPRHRGASPIQHAILAGDPRTGVTIMELTAGLDEGPMLLERSIPLDGHETGGSLTEVLAEVGAATILDAIREAKTTGLMSIPQDPAAATFAPLLSKADGVLDLARPAAELERRVRALNPWPMAQIPMKRGGLRVLSARVVSLSTAGEVGSMAPMSERMVIFTGDGGLELLEVQPPGKRSMSGADFLRGAGRGLPRGIPLDQC